MSTPDLGDLFTRHAPAPPTPAESAAALSAAGPAFADARRRHALGMSGAALIALLLIAGIAVSLQRPHTTVEFAGTPTTVTTPTGSSAPIAHFESPGGSIDAAIAEEGLTLITSMAAEGFTAMVDVMTAERLQVSFTGPERHVISLEVDTDGMIVEVDEPPAEPTADPGESVPDSPTTVPSPTVAPPTEPGAAPSTTAPTSGAAQPPESDEHERGDEDEDEDEDAPEDEDNRGNGNGKAKGKNTDKGADEDPDTDD